MNFLSQTAAAEAHRPPIRLFFLPVMEVLSGRSDLEKFKSGPGRAFSPLSRAGLLLRSGDPPHFLWRPRG